MNAYALTMAVFAIAGGRAGDRFGRRRVFLIGVTVFALLCLCGLSISSGTLIAAGRAQGIGAAIMASGRRRDRHRRLRGGAPSVRAIGVLVGVGGIGVSIGSLVGGFLVEEAGWRSIFFVNLPVAVIVIGLTLAGGPGAPPRASAGTWTGGA